MPRKPKLDRVPLNFKPKRETREKFIDLISAGRPKPTQEAMFEYLVDTAWGQLQRARQMGDEPK